MIDVFEKLKSFFGKEKKFFTPKSTNKPEKEDASLCSLLDFQERQNYKFSQKNSQNSSGSIKLSTLNPIYSAINISLIVILLGLKFHNQTTLPHDKIISGYSIPQYFDLYQINPMVFHIYQCLSGLIGYAIIYVLFSGTKLKLEYTKDKSLLNRLKLLLFLLFGSLFNLCTVIEAFFPYLDLQPPELYLAYKVLFIVSMFSACVFGVCLVSIFSHLSQFFEPSKKWFALKVASLVYITVFSVFYMAILLDNMKILELTISIEAIRERFDYGLYIMPYIIKLFSSLLILSFVDEMQSLFLAITENKETGNSVV